MKKLILGLLFAAVNANAQHFWAGGQGTSIGTDGTRVSHSGDTMTGQLTISASTLTVTGQDSNGYSLKLSSGLTMPSGTLSANISSVSYALVGSSLALNGSVFGTGTIFRSTQGFISGDPTTTQTTFGACFNSTVTFTTTGNPVRITFNGSVQDSSLAASMSLGVLQDGTYFDGQAGNKGLFFANEAVATDTMPALISYVTNTAPAAGSHSYCLVGAASAGTLSLRCGGGEMLCQFRVEEIH